jgi:hypothetical protein
MFFLIVPNTALSILNLAQHLHYLESRVPFRPSSEPCHSAKHSWGSYQISLAQPLFSLPCSSCSPPPVSSLVTALAWISDQQQYIPPLFLIWTSNLPSPRLPCTTYVDLTWGLLESGTQSLAPCWPGTDAGFPQSVHTSSPHEEMRELFLIEEDSVSWEC